MQTTSTYPIKCSIQRIAKSLFILLYILPAISFAQQQPEIWYFGYGAGIDFTSGSPVALTNGQINQWEGVATACDTAGNLLFYTDGMTVWNSNHQVMSNGTGLMGNNSCTQSATVVPIPGNSDQYYLFTPPEYSNTNGFRYSIIDMTLNGGLGDVTSVKNVLLLSTATEQCAVIPKNGESAWVITRDYSPVFYAYLVDASGISTPVVSNTGSTFTNPVGYMKASSLRDKIAIAHYDFSSTTSYFEIYDFDTATGTVSNPFQIDINSPVYGCEFSPDGTKLYAAQWGANIYQYDLTAGNSAAIIASQTLVGTSFSYVGDMQIGPDQKIYAALNNSSYLGVISSPNTLGNGCNYVDNGFYLGGPLSGIGLPSIEVFLQNQPFTGAVSFASTDTEVCEKFCVDFFDSSTNNPTSWLWLFPGGVPSSSTDQNPTQICYQNPGVYDVTLITSGTDTLTLPGYITVNATPPIPAITQAGYTLTSSAASSYQWQLNSVDIPGATNQSYDALQSGYYTVIISDNNGCVNAGTTYVLIDGVESVGNASDISIYPNPSNGYFTIEWNSEQIVTGTSLQIYNALGQLVFQSEESGTSSYKKEIQLNNITTGVYFIEVKSGDTMTRKKIVVF